MVDNKADIPPKDEVRPDSADTVADIVESGEAEVYLNAQAPPVEVHSYDSHFYSTGHVYTEGWTDEDDDDVWFHVADVIAIRRH